MSLCLDLSVFYYYPSLHCWWLRSFLWWWWFCMPMLPWRVLRCLSWLNMRCPVRGYPGGRWSDWLKQVPGKQFSYSWYWPVLKAHLNVDFAMLRYKTAFVVICGDQFHSLSRHAQWILTKYCSSSFESGRRIAAENGQKIPELRQASAGNRRKYSGKPCLPDRAFFVIQCNH